MIQGRRDLPMALLALALTGGWVWTAGAEEGQLPEPQAAKEPDGPVVDCQTRHQVIPRTCRRR